MVNIKKSFLAVVYLASFLVAMPSQPNIPQQPSTPIQHYIFGFIPDFLGLFNRGSSESDISNKFWEAVKLEGGLLPPDDKLEAIGIPADSPLWEKYSEFFKEKGEDILMEKITPEEIESTVNKYRKP